MKLSIIERARRYTASMPASIQGSQGSAALFAVAVVLVRGFGLDHETALMLLKEWNEGKALPLWSERELVAKLNSAARDGKMAYGSLLADDDKFRTAPYLPPAKPVAVSKPARTPKVYSPEELALQLEMQNRWKDPEPVKDEYITTVSHLRGCAREAVEILVEIGLLHFGFVFDYADRKEHLCFIFAQGPFRQARRMDGKELTDKEGKTTKSKTLPGSQAVGFFGWIGEPDQHHGESILLVEGVVGFLEAVSAIYWTGPNPSRWQVLAAHSANASRFCNTPDLLRQIAGRHVRIVQDNDPGGRIAAADWAQELLAVGCRVELVTLPQECKDLGDLLTAPPEVSHPILKGILELERKEAA